MIWKPIHGIDLRSFIYNFNERMKLLISNLDESNLKLNQLELNTQTGKFTIFVENGVLKMKNPDGAVRTFTLT